MLTAMCCVILTVRVNTLQILNVLQSDPFTKSVFTSVLPSDQLPDIVLERPKGYIVNVDGSDKPGSTWVAMFFMMTPDGEGDGAIEFMDNKHVLQSPMVLCVWPVLVVLCIT